MSEVEGLNKWQRQVRNLPPSVKSAFRDQGAKNGAKLVSAIKPHVPYRHGHLRDSVNWCFGLPPASEATGAFRLKQKDLTLRQQALNEAGLLVTVYEGSGLAYYARWVEFGTKYSPAGANRSWTRVLTRRSGSRLKADGRNLTRAHQATRAQPHFFPMVRLYAPKIKRSNVTAANKAIRAIAQA